MCKDFDMAIKSAVYVNCHVRHGYTPANYHPDHAKWVCHKCIDEAYNEYAIREVFEAYQPVSTQAA